MIFVRDAAGKRWRNTRKHGTRQALLGILLLGSAGCSFAPKYVRPVQPVPQAFPVPQENHASAARVGWRTFFIDPILQQLIETALSSNRDIRIAAGRIEEARSAFHIQGSALYPQLNGAASGLRGEIPFNLGAGEQSLDIKSVSALLSASWQIDFWGRLRNMRASARYQYLATEEARRAVATTLISGVATAYLREREYEERISLARDTIGAREESLRILRRRYEVGSGSKLEMTQAETLLAQARVALEALIQERGVNMNALTLLVGQPVEIAALPSALARSGLDAPLEAGLPSDLLENRPDIMAAEERLRGANADIGAARAAFFPNISLTGAFGTSSSALDNLFAAGTRAWAFYPSAQLPIFDGGRNKGNLDLAKARKNIAVAQYEQTVQQAFRDVSDALIRRAQLSRQIDATKDMLTALEERARLAQLRFDNGRSAYLEVLDAQRNLFDTQQGLVQLRSGYYANNVALYSALGGGFPAANVPEGGGSRTGA